MLNKELVLNRIAELCLEHNWTYNQLTIKAELSQGMIYQWYNKRRDRKPSFEAIDKICSAFQITISEFFAESSKDKLRVKEEKLIKSIKQLDENDVDVLIIVANNALKNKQSRNSKE